ncbi:hypothetical protein KSS87_007092 [Heliosperma pusillum]|nr:hypothetical protein KSS87_007092 [Heliosperma pusillum]
MEKFAKRVHRSGGGVGRGLGWGYLFAGRAKGMTVVIRRRDLGGWLVVTGARCTTTRVGDCGGVNKDGQIRHFFHRPSKAYTTGTRKRRKVHTDEDGSETRWHKTGKTRPVLISGKVRGYKKILVLYTNYGKQRKPQKTSWVMHQYHLGIDEEEKDGELVVSKVFYQTQPRQCGSILKLNGKTANASTRNESSEYYNQTSIISFEQRTNDTGTTPTVVFPFCCP